MVYDNSIPEMLRPLRGRCHVVEGDEDAEAVLHALGDALSRPGGFRTLRVRPGRAIYDFRTREGDFVVKAFEAKFMARISPARFCPTGREWRSVRHAGERGVPTSHAAAVFRCKGKPGVNYLVLRRIAGTTEFGAYLAREKERLCHDVKLARRVIRRFAQFVAGLHKAGLVHHDLHLRNILVRPPRAGAEAEFFIIDLDDEDFQSGTPPEHIRRQNLAYLSLSFLDCPRSARRRFLREYRKAMGDEGGEREVVNDIATQAAHRQFDLNTLRIATCGEASSSIARVERPDTLLLVYRRARDADLEQLERPLAGADPERWGALLHEHFELRLGEGHVWKLTCPIDRVDGPAARRKLEALWGRLLELNAVYAASPAPLACLLKPPGLSVFGRVPGALARLVDAHDDRDLQLYEDLGRQLVRLHRFGCFFLPLETEVLAEGLSIASSPRGGRSLMLTAPDHIFRGSPTTLGPQAVASLGRIGRAVLKFAGDRPMKEVIRSYARVLCLNRDDTDALLEESRRIPTGSTLVMTRGIEKSRADPHV